MQQTIFIDVREPEEFAGGHVEGAINVPPSQLLAGAPELKTVPKDARLVVYCRTGNRANTAEYMLRGMGYKNIINGINKDQVEAKFGL